MHALGELDPRIRAAISCFWAIEDVDAKLARLARDLETGRGRRNTGVCWGERVAIWGIGWWWGVVERRKRGFRKTKVFRNAL